MNKKEIFELISLNKYKIIGSGGDKKIKYVSDFDLVCNISAKSLERIIPKIFKKAMNTPNIYITDFKCGLYKSYPLRWSYDDVINGYKMIDDRIKFTLTDCINEEPGNTIKLDLICFFDDRFVEISCNYYINKQNENVETNLMIDIKKYFNEKNYLKMFKRIYSLAKIKNANETELQLLIDLFNSKIGEKFVFKTDVKVFLKVLKNTFKPVKETQVKKVLEKHNHLKLTELDGLVKKIDKEINEDIKQWIEKWN